MFPMYLSKYMKCNAYIYIYIALYVYAVLFMACSAFQANSPLGDKLYDPLPQLQLLQVRKSIPLAPLYPIPYPCGSLRILRPHILKY